MVNYQNAVIYKLCCKDPTITDEYIGSTCNRYRRKNAHKTICHNKNDCHHNFIVYKKIRETGGWSNWDMVILEEYSCESKVQLHTKEREWIELRRPNLNGVIRPSITEEEKKQYERDLQIKNNKTDKRKKYMKEYRQQQKLKNQSAITIQRFFKKYLGFK